MSDTLMGINEAETRVRKMNGQSNNGKIAYPSGTNERGNGGREHHAGGDQVGGDQSAPGKGGMHQKPNFGAPIKGMDNGTRKEAVRTVRNECHAMGDQVGNQPMNNVRMKEPRPMYRRGGRMRGMED